MASPSPVLGGSPQSAGNRIRDSLATSLGKSYGTVKDASLNMSSSYRSVINHDVVEEDTLQGLALKYNVTVQDIRRANNLWASESVHSRLVIKIPLNGGESISHNHSPKIPRSTNNQSEPSSLKGHLPTALPTIVTSNGTGHKKFDENDEEVRSKPRRRYVSSSAAASISTSGVKTIADILNSADEQLKVSQEFADRLAIRSASLSVSPDSYNRTPTVSVTELPPLHPQDSDTSQNRRTFKIPSNLSSEKLSASREQVEEDMFEL